MSTKGNIPEGLRATVKDCPVDFQAAENLIKRERKDLASARLVQPRDPEAAYTLLYDCMLHVGLAYMAASGVRPDIRGKHKTVIQYMAFALGKAYEDQTHFYDRMRRKRHHLIYEPGRYGTSEREMEEAEKVAQQFLRIVSKKIREENPQKELAFLSDL